MLNHCFLVGLAVLADMLLTTHFMTLVLLTVWKMPLCVCALFYIAFAPIEATFWSSTLTKIPNGTLAECCPPILAECCVFLTCMQTISLTKLTLTKSEAECMPITP